MDFFNQPTIFWKDSFYKNGTITLENNANEGFNVKYLDEDTVSIRCINRTTSDVLVSVEDAISLCNDISKTLSDILKFNKVEECRRKNESRLFKALENNQVETVYIYKLNEAPGCYVPAYTKINGGLFVYRIFIRPKEWSNRNRVVYDDYVCYDTIFSEETLKRFKGGIESKYKVNVDFCKDDDYRRPVLKLEDIKDIRYIKIFKYTKDLFRLVIYMDNNVIDNIYKSDELYTIYYYLDQNKSISYMNINCDDINRIKYLNSKGE